MKKSHIGIGVMVGILFSIALLSIPGGSCENCDMEEKNLEVIKVKDWIDMSKQEDVVILDIRTPEEFNEFHLDKAINFDFYRDNHREELEKLDKNKIYLTHCRSGRRSASNLELMKELGFISVYDMNGGISAYHEFIEKQKP